MIYMSSFDFPDGDREWDDLYKIKSTAYNTAYPFNILSRRGLTRLDFEPITILCGDNGSGKTTALNIIAETIGAQRDTLFNKSTFFPDYVGLCKYKLRSRLYEQCRIITSDDVFDYILNIRSINDGIDNRREQLFSEYNDMRDQNKSQDYRMRSLDDYDMIVRVNKARRQTRSQFVRGELKANVREQSNGESAFMYFTEKIGKNGIFLLDEPGNSLSPRLQLKLAEFIQQSARFFGCQFVISSHSPFMLAMEGAKIYDLDADPAAVKRWTELDNIRAYRDFFIAHADEF